MIEGKDDEETVRLTVEFLGIDELKARFILAIERGETLGDMVACDEDGVPLLPGDRLGSDDEAPRVSGP